MWGGSYTDSPWEKMGDMKQAFKIFEIVAGERGQLVRALAAQALSFKAPEPM